MAHLTNLEAKRKLGSSKLEQTILTNRNMNILLKKRLNLIEVDRKRALAAVSRTQREVKAELRAKKDEKFNLMLKYQKTKAASRSGKTKLDVPQHPENSFENDIEGELFTNGLINAPGVNSRMKRLSHRRRILPDFESDEENPSENEEDNRELTENDDYSDQLTVFEKPIIRPQTVSHSMLHMSVDKTTSSTERPRRLSDKSEATIMMTSGVVSFINEDARLKQIARSEDDGEFQPKENSTLPVPITGFGMHSQMRVDMGIAHSKPLTAPRTAVIKERKADRKKSVQFSRHRKSIVIGPDIFGEEQTDIPLLTQIGGMGSHSRLSVVKTKIASNEKAFLLRLRIQNQRQENEDVAKRVWDFIGRRPTSMFVPRKVHKIDEGESDVLTEAEEERKRSKFKAAANKTSNDP